LCLHEGQKGALGVLESTQTHVVEESVLERDSRGCFVSCVLFLVRGEKRKMFLVTLADLYIIAVQITVHVWSSHLGLKTLFAKLEDGSSVLGVCHRTTSHVQ